MNTSRRIIILFALYALFVSCVSIDLNKKEVKSQGVVYTAPSAPFRELGESKADKTWTHTSNGNSISFLSGCDDPADPSNERLQKEILTGIQDVKVEESNTISFNNREALQTKLFGKVDGVQIFIHILTFKKNNCNYTLSYTGRDKTYAQNQKDFVAFMGSFKAP